MQERQFT